MRLCERICVRRKPRVNSTDELGGYGVSNPVREVHNL